MTIKISEVRAAYETFEVVTDRTNIPISPLVRLLNAMPVFLEIVEAAMAHDAAGKAAAKIRFAWGKADDAGDPGADAMLDQVGDADREVNRCTCRYRAALAKVVP